MAHFFLLLRGLSHHKINGENILNCDLLFKLDLGIFVLNELFGRLQDFLSVSLSFWIRASECLWEKWILFRLCWYFRFCYSTSIQTTKLFYNLMDFISKIFRFSIVFLYYDLNEIPKFISANSLLSLSAEVFCHSLTYLSLPSRFIRIKLYSKHLWYNRPSHHKWNNFFLFRGKFTKLWVQFIADQLVSVA